MLSAQHNALADPPFCKFSSNDLFARHLYRLNTQDKDRLFQGSMPRSRQVARSEVGRIETVARLQNGGWRYCGGKWFCSKPDTALAMVLSESGEPRHVFKWMTDMIKSSPRTPCITSARRWSLTVGGVRLEGSHSLTEADRQRLAKAVLTEKPSSRNLQAPAAPGPERPPDLLSRAAQDAEISRFAAK